jgi:hypothetical protein
MSGRWFSEFPFGCGDHFRSVAAEGGFWIDFAPTAGGCEFEQLFSSGFLR